MEINSFDDADLEIDDLFVGLRAAEPEKGLDEGMDGAQGVFYLGDGE